MSEKLVIYHGNCYDGVTAAWVCSKFFTNAKFLPLNYSDPVPDVKGKDVIIVDFSFKRPGMIQIASEAGALLVLDHHKTAEAELKGLSEELARVYGFNVEIHFDMNRSGAGMAWDYFFPKSARPFLVDYVEDRDLWRFKLPHSKEINAWIQSFDIDLDTWIREVGIGILGDAKREGISLLRLENKYVKQICNNARLKRLGEHIAPYVETSILMSEVCHYLIHEHMEYKEYPFAFYSFYRKDGKIQYGMRSKGDFDVSVIAKQYGGGGHKNAAGFELDHEI